MSDAVGLENKVYHKVDHKVYHGMGTIFYNNPIFASKTLSCLALTIYVNIRGYFKTSWD